ncbi:hypothetical protein KVT40_001373 [Elsinoe batatas]|uniref:F-box domain-containing protein n=1 Tax=Elsinoe batatas TaxID=2601811 RepID=A0A8K0L783_9PEZI|nr:hypothetical protein KVT40_001373 [Elsinoe batatas]
MVEPIPSPRGSLDLLQLPHEVLQLIVDQITARPHLWSLRKVNQVFRNLSHARLYKGVLVRTEDPDEKHYSFFDSELIALKWIRKVRFTQARRPHALDPVLDHILEVLPSGTLTRFECEIMSIMGSTTFKRLLDEQNALRCLAAPYLPSGDFLDTHKKPILPELQMLRFMYGKSTGNVAAALMTGATKFCELDLMYSEKDTDQLMALLSNVKGNLRRLTLRMPLPECLQRFLPLSMELEVLNSLTLLDYFPGPEPVFKDSLDISQWMKRLTQLHISGYLSDSRSELESLEEALRKLPSQLKVLVLDLNCSHRHIDISVIPSSVRTLGMRFQGGTSGHFACEWRDGAWGHQCDGLEQLALVLPKCEASEGLRQKWFDKVQDICASTNLNTLQINNDHRSLIDSTKDTGWWKSDVSITLLRELAHDIYSCSSDGGSSDNMSAPRSDRNGPLQVLSFGVGQLHEVEGGLPKPIFMRQHATISDDDASLARLATLSEIEGFAENRSIVALL